MGIQLSTNFDLASKIPLDSRITVSNQTERNALVTNNQAYPGIIVYVTGDNKYYHYNTGNQWVEFGSEATEQISGYVDENFYLKSNPSGFINSESSILKGSEDVIYVDGAGTTGVNGIYIKTSTSPLTYTKYNSSSYRIILNTGVAVPGLGFQWNIQEFFGGGVGWQQRYYGGGSSLGHISPLDFPDWSRGGIYAGSAPNPRLYSYISTFDKYYKPFQEFALINGAGNKLKFGITGNWSFFSYSLYARPQNGTIALLNDFSGVVYTTGNQTISGDKTFQANEYIFSGANISIVGDSTFSIETGNVVTNGIVKNLGGASGMQVMTTGEYNAITPINGVVYILI